MSWLRRGVTSPKFPVEENNIIARDGKALPVEFTLLMAREVIDDPYAIGRSSSNRRSPTGARWPRTTARP